jgi:hypothetical protein
LSHISKISLLCDSLDILAKTARSFGGQLVRDKQTYEWFGKFMNDYPLPDGVKAEDLGKCDHAISIPNCKYEIGISKNVKGKYELRWDFWSAGGLEKVIGKDGGLFKQRYTDFRTEYELKLKKKKFRRTVEQDGTIQYEIQM